MMMTKREFAEAIMRNFAINELGQDIREIDITKIEEYHITMSSNLAVAMEFLGLLKNEDFINYARERGGIMFNSFNVEKDKMDSITVRDILSLLPDDPS